MKFVSIGEVIRFADIWDNNEGDRISPWDMEPVDPDRRPSEPGTGVPVMPEEMACTLYQPRAEDWPPGGDRVAECDRIGAATSQVIIKNSSLEEFKDKTLFSTGYELSYCGTYIRFMRTSSSIKAQLKNRFYRRVTAVQYDVRYIYTNACKLNQEGSDIVRHASIITDLCMKIIRNRDVEDATAVYHRLVENYRASPDEDDSGHSTSRDKRSNGKKNGHKLLTRPRRVPSATHQLTLIQSQTTTNRMALVKVDLPITDQY